jgi:oligosaccharide repeat unit polymerase
MVLSILNIIVLVCIARNYLRTYKSIIHPVSIYCISWILSLLVTLPDLFGGNKVTDTGNYMILISTGFVIIGSQIGEKFGVSRIVRLERNYLHLQKYCYFATAFAFANLFANYIVYLEIVRMGDLLGLSPWLIGRAVFSGGELVLEIPIWMKILNTLAIPTLLYTVSLYTNMQRFRLVCILLVLGSVLSYGLISGSRTSIIFSLGCSLVLLSVQAKLKRSFFVYLSILGILFFFLVSAFQGKITFFDLGFGYYGGGIVGLSRIVDNPQLVCPEGMSYRAVSAVLYPLGIGKPPPSPVLGYVCEDFGNIYTALIGPWRDFGWIGVMGYSLLFGFATSLAFYLLKSNKTEPLFQIIYSYCFMATVLFPVGDALFVSFTPVVALVLFRLILLKFKSC